MLKWKEEGIKKDDVPASPVIDKPKRKIPILNRVGSPCRKEKE
jgi:hypothetical protein